MEKSKIYTPEKISNGNDGYTKFRIPIYQRLFEWEDEQLLGLLKDMKEFFEKEKEDTSSKYYLGMMTISPSEDNVADLVDGQQRFTTIMLLGIVMQDIYNGWSKFIAKEAKEDRLCFVAREDDQVYLQWIIENYKNSYETASKDIPVPVNLKMQHALKVIEDFLNGLGESKKGYCEDVYKRLAFFMAELPAGYKESPKKLNKYFETMNSAGRSLEQHEKIKVELLKKCPDVYLKVKFNDIWNKVEQMEERLFDNKNTNEPTIRSTIDAEIEKTCLKGIIPERKEEEQEKQERDYGMIKDIESSEKKPEEQQARKDIGSVIDFQELLILALNFTLNKELPLDKHKLEEIFKNLLADSNKIPCFYRNLYLIRLLLDRYVIRVEKEDGWNTYRLRLTEGENITEDERKLIQYQSMLYVSTSAHLWLIPYLKWLIGLDTRVGLDASKLLNKLKEIDNNQIHKELRPVEDMAYDKGIERYWFWRLDYYLWERRKSIFKEEKQKIVDSYVFRANRSIEHLHPQDETNNEQWEKTDVHSFGNLAMISASFNSQQSNKSVEEKFGRIKSQLRNKELESLKMYKMYLTADERDSNWTIEAKEKHQEEMYKILEESYTKEQNN